MLTHMFDDGTYGIVYSLDETYEQVRLVSMAAHRLFEAFASPSPLATLPQGCACRQDV